jgi:hypothetical protein
VDEERYEDREPKFRVSVVGRVCDEAFGKFVQCYCNTRLQADGEEGICWHVVMVVFRWGIEMVFVMVVRAYRRN